MNEIQKSGTQDEILTEDASQSERDAPTDVKWSSTSEDFTFVEDGDLKSSELPLPMQSTTVSQLVTEGAGTETTADPRQAGHAVKTLYPQRKHRSLLHKRQIPGPSGKGMCHTNCSQTLWIYFHKIAKKK